MKFYLDGLERSGNVFFVHALTLTTGVEIVSSRSHSLETLQSHNTEDPFIVPVRDALPSIASAHIYIKKFLSDHNLETRGDGFLDMSNFNIIIKRFKEYTDYLVENPKFFIVPFHEFTKDHEKVISVILKHYPIAKIEKHFTYKDITDYASKNNDHQVFHTEFGNFPRQTPKKDEIEEILKSGYINEINEIQSNIDKLYERYYSLENYDIIDL